MERYRFRPRVNCSADQSDQILQTGNGKSFYRNKHHSHNDDIHPTDSGHPCSSLSSTAEKDWLIVIIDGIENFKYERDLREKTVFCSVEANVSLSLTIVVRGG